MKLSLVALLLSCLPHWAGAAKIPNQAIADLVLGKPGLTTTQWSPISSTSMSNPSSITIDPKTGKLFVAEENNRRILRFSDYRALRNGVSAEAVFGQPDFNTLGSPQGASGFGHIRGIFLDLKGRLWVADGGNNRVLMFEDPSTCDSFPAAARVYGQPDFTTYGWETDTGSHGSGMHAGNMKNPYGVFVDSEDRLWVADTINNRVLRFDAISTKPNGAAADGVLGKTNFTGTDAGWSSRMSPTDIAVSPDGTLFVASPGGNRVLRFDHAASLPNGAAATAFLGQVDGETYSAGTSATRFNTPFGLHLTADDSLWVTDFYNNRVLRFSNASDKPTGSAADGVVGQPDFNTSTPGTTDRTLDRPYMTPFVDPEGNLWVPDSYNNRVLRFPPDVTKPTLVVTGTVPKTLKRKRIRIRGTASDTYGISKVYYRLGSGRWKNAIGTSSWKLNSRLKRGWNRIMIYSVDSVGNKSTKKIYRVKR